MKGLKLGILNTTRSNNRQNDCMIGFLPFWTISRSAPCWLAAASANCGEQSRVGTLMKRMSIEALYRKPGTSKKHPGLGLRVVEHAWSQSLAWWTLAGGVIFGVCLHDYTCFSSGSMSKTLAGDWVASFFSNSRQPLGGELI